MAAKKKASKALVTPWQQELAKQAKSGKAPKEKAFVSDRISTKGAKFSIGGVIAGRELDCVVVAWNFENTYYDSDYIEGEASVPGCFALGYDEDTLAPHTDSPSKQASECVDCEQNEWGSGRGEGKACSNRRRLVLVAFDKQTGKPVEGMKQLSLAPTSIGNWKSFVQDCENHGLHTLQMAVNISFDEESTAPNPPLVFTQIKEITNAKVLDGLASLIEPAEKMLEKPYDVSSYKKSKKKSKKKASKKKASKKKRSRLS
jgi:hypothetical protein